MTKPILLMTRPANSAERFVARLPTSLSSRIRVIYSPLMKIVPTDASPDLSATGGVLFSSAQGVALSPDGGGRAAFCVGARTAQAATARGWDVQQMAQTADDLVTKLGQIGNTGPLLHLAGRHRRGDIAERLNAMGVPTQVVVLYDQQLQNLSNEAHDVLSGELPVVVPLFSPRTAAHFAAQAGPQRNVQCAALSNPVAQALGPLWEKQVICAPAPTGNEMMRVVEMLLSRASLA